MRNQEVVELIALRKIFGLISTHISCVTQWSSCGHDILAGLIRRHLTLIRDILSLTSQIACSQILRAPNRIVSARINLLYCLAFIGLFIRLRLNLYYIFPCIVEFMRRCMIIVRHLFSYRRPSELHSFYEKFHANFCDRSEISHSEYLIYTFASKRSSNKKSKQIRDSLEDPKPILQLSYFVGKAEAPTQIFSGLLFVFLHGIIQGWKW